MPAPRFETTGDQARATAFFEDRPAAAKLWGKVVAAVGRLGACSLVATTSRVALVAGTRFLWVHGAHLDGSITVGFLLPARVASARLRSAAAGSRWSHHLKLRDLDPEALAWFAAAYEWDRAKVADTPVKVRR